VNFIRRWSTGVVRFHGHEVIVPHRDAKAIKTIAKVIFAMTPAAMNGQMAGGWALKRALETFYELKQQAAGLYPPKSGQR
jgi:hypothetical protein